MANNGDSLKSYKYLNIQANIDSSLSVDKADKGIKLIKLTILPKRSYSNKISTDSWYKV